MKYYDPTKILKTNSIYNLVVGERSNGKTFAFLRYALQEYKRTGKQFAYIRRNERDFQGSNSARLVFDTLVTPNKNYISEIFGKNYDRIEYYGGRYFLCENDDNKSTRTDKVVGFGFVLANQEQYKSTSYNNVSTIIYDEFITRTRYLYDEWIMFANLLSTIIRDRDDVKIFMLANTVNQFGCPYFKEMGLNDITKQKQGTIDVYQHNERLTISVEYCASTGDSKKSNKYFAFDDNPRLKLITEGSWEIANYPRAPIRILPKHILYTMFLEFENNTLELNVINDIDNYFLFIHPKTTEIKDANAYIITTRLDGKPNHISNIKKANTKPFTIIKQFFNSDKVFYSDNRTGEIIWAYLKWCDMIN